MTVLPDPVGWWAALERPLRRLPRWGAASVLALTIAACAWSIPAVSRFAADYAAMVDTRAGRGDPRDMDLYAAIDRRIAAGEGYYSAALAEQRAGGYPTRPFVTVRTPVLAWGSLPLGLAGWRVVAIGLWLATAIGLLRAVAAQASRLEALAAAALAAAFGAAAFIPRVGLSHEIVAGLFVSTALAVYRPGRWWPALALAGLGVAVRELAAPFLILWAAFAASQRRWTELAAVAGVLVLFALAMAAHAAAVAGATLPGDPISPAWAGMLGPALPLFALVSITPLGDLPGALAAPLAVLALLGWVGLGGRLGLFAALWFLGMIAGVSLFGRIEHFYWLALLIPLYGAGLAFVPRALADLMAALR